MAAGSQRETRQRRLVLVVSEVCAREYDATEVRSRGTRIEDGAMGRPSSRTAVGVAKEREELIRSPFCWWSWFEFERNVSRLSVEVDGGSTPRLEGHSVHTSIGLILGIQQSPDLGGGIAIPGSQGLYLQHP